MVGKGGGARSSSSRRRSTSSSNNRSNGDSDSNSLGNSHDNGNGIGHSQGPGSNSPAAGPQCPSTIGTPWAADEHMHPGRRCAGFCSVSRREFPQVAWMSPPRPRGLADRSQQLRQKKKSREG